MVDVEDILVVILIAVIVVATIAYFSGTLGPLSDVNTLAMQTTLMNTNTVLFF